METCRRLIVTLSKEYLMNREGFVVNDTTRECTKCSSIFTRTNKTVTLCPTCNSNRVKCTSPEKKMLARARNWGEVERS